MNHQVQIQATGGPEVLAWVEAPLPDPGPGEARIRHRAIGVNYIDVYHRSGAYPVPLPAVPGFEAAGVVEALGPGATGLRVGQRVGYVDGPTGAYAEARNHPADRLVPLPDSLSDEDAAALLFKGLTAHMLVRRIWRADRGPWVLVHAAAGGVGLILTRWLAREGAKVIGVVSTPEKARTVEAEGALATVVVPRGSTYAGLATEVRRLTDGAGVGTVFDSVGQDSFTASLDSLAPFGLLASYGRSSGPVPPVDAAELGRRGSLAFQRPSIFQHIAASGDLRSAAAELFQAHAEGKARPHIHGRLPLRDAARAHALLESRETRGALILVP
jgi:NADPH2:quinone reductase